MDQAQETQVMQAFYDRIFEMVTYSTGNSPAVNNPSSTLVQLVTDGSINLDDYKDMISPDNPNGDLTHAEAFYTKFNKSGGITPTYEPATGSLGQVYKEIVDGAQTSLKPSKQQQDEYNNALKYLYVDVKTKDPLTGKVTISKGSSAIYKAYLTFQKAYADALANYRTTFLNYDMSQPEQQKKFEAQAPKLQNAIDTAWSNWTADGHKAAVEEVLAFLAASDNNIIANVIGDAQKLMSTSQQAPLVTGGGPWWLTGASPSTFWDTTKAEGWMNFTLNSNHLYTSDSSYYSQYQQSAGSSFLGLIGWSEQSAGKTTSQSHHMQGDNLAISGQMMTVTIERPWLSSSLFNLSGWNELGQPAGWISKGSLSGIAAALTAGDKQDMPVVPTAFVIVKNLTVTANWTAQDSSALTTATSASGGYHFGPFHAGGSSSSGSSHHTSNSTFSGGTLSMPDPQIVAFVNHITPMSPPEKG
ncbi:MAG: hypothetical protein ACRBB0_26555 [Pelagimonas sp.]|uniref:hypothetical protein n=1 Tax=Pelagimonas sp. TaxID=2073170 RepID=UPI003D6AC301